jgi:hypothetical protein
MVARLPVAGSAGAVARLEAEMALAATARCWSQGRFLAWLADS